jgi:hypothetical protein
MQEANSPSSSEIIINKISGHSSRGDSSHHTEVFDESVKPTINGRYMSITLTRLLVNLPFKSRYKGNICCFTLLNAIWHNTWDYRLNTIFSVPVKMIDSEGFQHSSHSGVDYLEFCKVVLPDTKQIVEASFSPPDQVLEARAKTKGWVWFDALPRNVIPHRFIFQVRVYEKPGETDGWVKDFETFEFVLTNYDQVVPKKLT